MKDFIFITAVNKLSGLLADDNVHSQNRYMLKVGLLLLSQDCDNKFNKILFTHIN